MVICQVPTFGIRSSFIDVFFFFNFASLLVPESQINQLQYRLDKLKEELDNREQVNREQIDDFETKNDT